MRVTLPPSPPGTRSTSAPLAPWPGHVTALRRQGRLLMDRGDYSAAGPIWESLRRSLPRDAEARHCLGQILTMLQAQETAIRAPAGPQLRPGPASAVASTAARPTAGPPSPLPSTSGSRADAVLLALHTAVRLQDPSALLAALEVAREILPAEEAKDLVALHGPSLIPWLGRLDHHDDAMREDVERRAAELVAGHDRLLLHLLRQIAEEGRCVAVTSLLGKLTSRPPPAPGDTAATLDLIAALLPGYAEEAQGAALAARLLGDGGHHGAAIDWWRRALGLAPGTANRRGLLAALRAAGDDSALAAEVGYGSRTGPRLRCGRKANKAPSSSLCVTWCNRPNGAAMSQP